MRGDYRRAEEVLSHNFAGGHNFFIATVETEDGVLYFAHLPGCCRWNKSLGDALAGGGYFMSAQTAKQTADQYCTIYKDHSPEQIIIKPLDPDLAMNELAAGRRRIQKEIDDAIEEQRKNPVKRDYYQ
jgi:hypothetical protein